MDLVFHDHSHDDLVTALVPYIDEVPPWGEQGCGPAIENGQWPGLTSIHDRKQMGFITAINAASHFVKTPWMLIWNSDAKPLFSFEELKLALQQCEPEIKVVGFAQVPPPDIIEKTKGRMKGKVAAWFNVTDTGPVALWMDAEFSRTIGRGLLHGTAYCPLYAVRTDWFRNVGGLSPIYGPGNYDDAHFWRWTRRLGGQTAACPGLHYEHAQRVSFEAVYSKEALQGLYQENLRRYLLSWGALESAQAQESSLLASSDTSATAAEAEAS